MSGLRAFLTLSRVSLLPTVWSNCLAGWWLGGAGNDGKLPFVLVGSTCLYFGGAFLNDAFDAPFDREHRRTRPIPAGVVTLGTVWGWGLTWLVAGIASLSFVAPVTGSLGLALGCWLLFYNAAHRLVTFSSVLLGISRGFLYLIASSMAMDGITGWALWGGIAQSLYVAGIGVPLRRENPAEPVRYWPMLLLCAPICLALLVNTGEYREPGLLLCAVLALWILRCVRHSLWSFAPRTALTTAGLQAGIVLVDWLAVPDVPRHLSFIFIGLFLAAWSSQRISRPAP